MKRTIKRAGATLGLLALLVPAASRAQTAVGSYTITPTYTQNWDGVTAPAIPSGFTQLPSSTSDYQTESTTSTSSPNGLTNTNTSGSAEAIGYTGGSAVANQYVETMYQCSTISGSTISPGVIVRGSGTSYSTLNSYLSRFSCSTTSNFRISKIAQGAETSLASVALASAPTANVWYRLRLFAYQTTLSAQLQRMSDGYWLNSSGAFVQDTSGNTVALTTTDSTYASGFPGQSFYGTTTGPVYSDDFSTGTVASSAPSGTTIAANNAALTYSPANWNVTSTSAETIYAGAYMTLYYTGSTPPTLNFDVSANTSPLPQIGIQVDDQAVQRSTLAATVTPTAPANTTAWPRHLLRLVYMSNSNSGTSWSPRNLSMTLTGLTIPNGTSVYAYTPAPLTGIAFGDSISVGFYALNKTGAQVDVSDATVAVPWLLRRFLGAEIGIVGSPGEPVSPTTPVNTNAIAGRPSNTGIPPLPDSFNLLWAGQARTFPANLDFVLTNIGTNDYLRSYNCAGVTEGMTRYLNGLLAAIPAKTRIFVQQPYAEAGQYPAFVGCIQAGIQASTNPSRVTYLSTTGQMDLSQTADSIHPYGVLDQQFAGTLAGQMAAVLNVKVPTYTYWTGTYN